MIQKAMAQSKKRTSLKSLTNTQLRSSKQKHVRLAAIDIGSNAIRMVIADFSLQGMRLIQKYRFPIRLGADVFVSGKISAKNLKLSARTFKQFKEVSENFQVSQIRAVGTSALREAKNQKAFVELIRRKSRIPIEIIDGVEEAQLIHEAVRHEVVLDTHQALLIDIGGGSVELSYSERGMMMATQSFPFGTVRTLELMKKKNLSESQLSLVIGDFLSPLTHFIQSHGRGHKVDFAIGTGGNLESLGKLKPILLKSSSRTFLTFLELGEILQKLEKMTIKDRIEKLKMRPDRADVIVPAGLVIQTVMQQANISKLLIPHVGLKDGLLWSLAQRADYFSKSLG